jgi:ABC-type Fe3+-siderophore transport system permease subunit
LRHIILGLAAIALVISPPLIVLATSHLTLWDGEGGLLGFLFLLFGLAGGIALFGWSASVGRYHAEAESNPRDGYRVGKTLADPARKDATVTRILFRSGPVPPAKSGEPIRRCPSCTAANPAGASRCHFCRARLFATARCGSCGAANSAASDKCEFCGTKLAHYTEFEAESAEVLHPDLVLAAVVTVSLYIAGAVLLSLWRNELADWVVAIAIVFVAVVVTLRLLMRDTSSDLAPDWGDRGEPGISPFGGPTST